MPTRSDTEPSRRMSHPAQWPQRTRTRRYRNGKSASDHSSSHKRTESLQLERQTAARYARWSSARYPSDSWRRTDALRGGFPISLQLRTVRGRDVVRRRMPGALQHAQIGDDRPAILNRNLKLIGRHGPAPVADHVEN